MNENLLIIDDAVSGPDSAEASDLGIAPGQKPPALLSVRGVFFRYLRHVRNDDDEICAWEYGDGNGRRFRVWND